MKEIKRLIPILLMITVCCAIMALIDGIVQPGYAAKSAVKMILFLLCPVGYLYFDKQLSLQSLLRPNKKGLFIALFLGAGVYILILGAYFSLRNVLDFSAIASSLTETVGVNKTNFVFVALYISFINSFLEEFFFRGFSFLTLKKLAPRKFAYITSSLYFAFYHMAMMVGWFSPGIYLLAIAGLFVGGLLFNYLNERNRNIYTSWMVHMFANFAINTVGFILFGII